MSKKCVLYDRDCIDCGECDRCDLDPDKICNNCGKCLEMDETDYRGLIIDEILQEKDYSKNDDLD